MARPQQKPAQDQHAAQAGLKVVDSAKAKPAGKPAQEVAKAQDEAAARKRLHPARVWPD